MREEQDCDASAAQPANFRGGELVAFADARSGGTNLDDVSRYFLRESMPVFACILGFDVSEELAV